MYFCNFYTMRLYEQLHSDNVNMKKDIQYVIISSWTNKIAIYFLPSSGFEHVSCYIHTVSNHNTHIGLICLLFECVQEQWYFTCVLLILHGPFNFDNQTGRFRSTSLGTCWSTIIPMTDSTGFSLTYSIKWSLWECSHLSYE